MVSASTDNTLKVWIFDSPDGGARLLKSREGHSGHPTKLRYYGGTTSASMRDNASAESCELLSAGSDCTLRYVLDGCILMHFTNPCSQPSYQPHPLLLKLKHLTLIHPHPSIIQIL